LCLLKEYDYPGNVRELRSIMQSAANLALNGVITPDVLPRHLRRREGAAECLQAASAETILPLAQIERNHILAVYARTGNNKSQTARLLGIGLNTLRRKLKAYGLG
jgi:transcriptional regulator with PAS, ATPase and Fis domain